MNNFGPGILLLVAYFIAPLIQVVASIVYYSRQRNLPGLGLVVGSIGGLVVLAASLYGPMFMTESTFSIAFRMSTYLGLGFGLLFAVSLLAVLRNVPRSPRGLRTAPGAREDEPVVPV